MVTANDTIELSLFNLACFELERLLYFGVLQRCMVLFWGVVDEIFELLDEVLPTFEFGFIVDGATEKLSDEDRVPPLNLEFRSLRAFEEVGILLLVRFFFEGDSIVIGGETNCPWFFFIDDQSPTEDIVESSHAVDSVVVHVSPNPNFC